MRLRRSACAVLAAVLAAGLTACSGSGNGAQDEGAGRDVIRFAEFPGVVPNWILPITDPGHNGTPNTLQFSWLMWRPLFWKGNGAEPTLDERLALAGEPEYSSDKRTVTVRLHDYNWSDGKPITSRDVEFWINLIKHNPDRWSGYVKGNLPDNIDGFEAVDDKTFKLKLSDSVSSDWFTANQLSLIVPLPHHAWGKGDDDRTEAGAKALLDHLMAEAKKPAEYAANPLWKVVSGPWTLKEYTTDGHITFVPNPSYAGPNKATVKRFEQVPFTTEDAAFNALVAGDVDVGPLPFKNLNQRERLERDGYTFVPWKNWTVNYLALNYNNPTTGPLVRQTYVRQAMQSLIDQPLIIDKVFNGQGAQQYGPIPLEPANPYATVKKAPFPYDENKAVTLLREHGWDVKPGGQTTCAKPGTGAGQCGEGIEAGAPLAFEAIVTSNRKPVLLEMQAQQSVFQQKAGIGFQVRPTPFAQIITEAFAPCTRDKPDGCPWQTAVWGGGSNVQPYPTGEQLFHSTGSSNAGHYSDPKADELIEATITGGAEELKAYEDYLAEQVPVLWVPNPSYQLSMIRTGLQGAEGQNPYGGVTPELWNWKK